MEENNIGNELAQFYKAFSVVYERDRDFLIANDILLQGKAKKANPIEKMDKFLHEFQDRMKERLFRDFHTKGEYLDEEEVKAFEGYYGTKKSRWSLLANQKNPLNKENPATRKRKYPFNENFNAFSNGSGPSSDYISKKMKLTDISNTVKCGEFNIYVDEQFRSIIPESTKLVNEYAGLCHKLKFTLPTAKALDSKPKKLSWVTEEMNKFSSKATKDKQKLELIQNVINFFNLIKAHNSFLLD